MFKPGDLAIQIKSVAGNEGAIVTLESFVGFLSSVDGTEYSNCWHVLYPRLANTLTAFGIINNHRTDGYIPENWLRPVSGLGDEDTIDTEKPIEVTAE